MGRTLGDSRVSSNSAARQAGHLDVPTGASTAVVPASRHRSELTIINDSDTTIYLMLDVYDGGDTSTPAAAVNTGIRLNANGGQWTTSAYTGAVRAFHAGAADKRLLIIDI